MPERIPIGAAREVAKSWGLRQVILVAWDGERVHVVTYGVNQEDCDQAAIGGNIVKKAIGYPESLCNGEPSRVKKLKEDNRWLKLRVSQLESAVESVSQGAAFAQAKLVDRIAELEATMEAYKPAVRHYCVYCGGKMPPDAESDGRCPGCG